MFCRSFCLSEQLVSKNSDISNFTNHSLLVCGIKTIVANATSSAASVFTSDILSWITSTFVLTIVTQITATALIAGRIYYASLPDTGELDKRHRSRYMALVWLVVESGAIYTSAALIQLITYLEKMNAGVIMEFALSQLSVIPAFRFCMCILLNFTVRLWSHL